MLYGGMSRLSENSVLNLKNKSHSVTAEVEVPAGGANGVIVAQGGAFADWRYLQEGRPKYCHNLAGLMRFYVEGSSTVREGKHQVRLEFPYDGGGLAKGGTSALYIDGNKVGEGRINATVPMLYSADETCDLDCDTGTTSARTHVSGQQVHRHGQLGPARRRRRQPRPPHLPGRAHAHRDRNPIRHVAPDGGFQSPGRVAAKRTGDPPPRPETS